jgi:hypothetical protein
MASLEMSEPHSVCLMLLYFTNFSFTLINNWLDVMRLVNNIIKMWADGMGLPLEMEG